MEVLDADRMREADRIAIEEMRIPGLVLMENAGRLVADAIADGVDGLQHRRVVVVAGPGNNGGDGFVVARHLLLAGVDVRVLLAGTTLDRLEGDAAAMASAWAGIGGPLDACPDVRAWGAAAGVLEEADVIVDALFGTGLTRPLKGLAARAVDAVNRAGDRGALVVSVDLPSGLSGAHAFVPGPAVSADATITFARPKPPHLLPPADDLCGDVVLVDIGIPDGAITRTAPDLHWVVAEEAALLLPLRDADDHKGRFGHVVVVGGSCGKAGAAALTGLGALRAGAGLVTVAAPSAVRAEVAGFAAELMTEPLPSGKDGALAAAAAAAALAVAERASVLAAGPGIGQSAPAQQALRRLVGRARVPVVLDADGLNAFTGRARSALRRHEAPLVITPHPGEAARLAGVDVEEIQADRVGWARKLAAECAGVCVLKGHRTVVADESGRAFINSTGNPGMATGGMGDVLTGLIAGLMAQKLEPLDAAILGVFLHGLAADLAVVEADTEQTLTASSVLDTLAAAWEHLWGVPSGEDDADGDD